MGDRANVVVYDPTEDNAPGEAVFLYTHWDGCELPGILASALHSKYGKARANDGAYLARIIFQAMCPNPGEMSYGISTRLTDNEYPLLVVDVPRQVVIEYPEGRYRDVGFADLLEYTGTPFASYAGEWAL